MAFRLNRPGVGEVLTRRETAGPVNALTAQIQAEVQAAVGSDVVVEMTPYRTDRAAASVTILDPMGLHLQATQGVLTRAAARLGLEIRSRR
ncbi:hypothetical protein [Gordonia rubripertincta]|uniref:hypothetical protein n=1 Tax=Gordonia rubripertincta TaxID=36822 RepID=UPI0015FCEF99|nr:hypothetical protein [Gordonia rubripertincta]QMU22505.1 hypothetical protein H3V45_08575 [Gordonia rubripertincta]